MSSDPSGSSRFDHVTPLVVDVDGTLVSGDLLAEGIARLMSSSPMRLLLLPWWLARGRANLKRQVARRSTVRPESVVLNEGVLAELRTARDAGRPVWLASGADETVVGPISEFVGATGFIASEGTTNLVSAEKARALVRKFGDQGFDYIGNGRQDLPVWKQCRRAGGVALSRRVRRRLARLGVVPKLIEGQRGNARDYIKTFRPHQWVKNLLVFIPALAAHLVDPVAYVSLLGAFCALCLCTSGTYVFNDLLDLPHDRQHATKRRRPMASGRVPLATTSALGSVATATGLAVAFALPGDAGPWVVTYVVGTVAYSLFAKRQFFLDVLVLAFLYAIRILIGGAVLDIEISPWLTAFSLFAFLALAVVKRLVELRGMANLEATTIKGRAYRQEDAVGIVSLGSAGAFAAVVVLAVYIGSAEVVSQYEAAELLWLACPLLIYWFGRIILLANRGLVDDDPVVFAVRDRVSWIVGIGVAGVFLLSA